MGIPRSTEVSWNPNRYRYGSDNQTETKIVNIGAGQVLKEGSVLGKVDATQEYVLCAKTQQNGQPVADGSQNPRVVLAADVDTTNGAEDAVSYSKGTFNGTWLKLGNGHTLASVEDGLRGYGVYFTLPAIPAVG